MLMTQQHDTSHSIARTNFTDEVATAGKVPGAAVAIAQSMYPAGRDALGLSPVIGGVGAVLREERKWL
jgi:hypothetical protein